MAKSILTVSARLGGQAEAVLRAIAHDKLDGIGDIPDTDSVTRIVSAWSVDGSGQRIKMVGLMVPVSPLDSVDEGDNLEVSLPIRIVLGAEVGVVLRDVDNLSMHRNFSTTHIFGAEGNGIDYVIPIARRIRHHQPVRNNFRQAVYNICAFLLKYQGRGLLEWRNVLQEAQKIRQDRGIRHITGHGNRWRSMLVGDPRAGKW